MKIKKLINFIIIFLLLITNILAAELNTEEENNEFKDYINILITEYHNFFDANEIIEAIGGKFILSACSENSVFDTKCLTADTWLGLDNYDYLGMITNGIPDGIGIITDYRSTIISEIKNGNINGKAKIIFPNEDYIIVNFKDNRFESGKKRYFKKNDASFTNDGSLILEKTFTEIDKVYCFMNKEISSINCKNGQYTGEAPVLEIKNPITEDYKKLYNEKKIALKQIQEKSKAINMINNNLDLSNYLVKYGLALKTKEVFRFDEWSNVEEKNKHLSIYEFYDNGKGLNYFVDKHGDFNEGNIDWILTEDNNLNAKNILSHCPPSQIYLDLKNNIAENKKRIFCDGAQYSIYKYEIILDIDKTYIAKKKEEAEKKQRLIDEYNLVLDQIYKDKNEKKRLKKLIWEMRKCGHDAGKLEFKANKNSGIIRDISSAIQRAESAIGSHNMLRMRQEQSNLRRLAHEAFSSVAVSYGTNNITAKFCKSLDKKYEFKHSLSFDNWKIKNNKS